jgi:hypothetical protein
MLLAARTCLKLCVPCTFEFLISASPHPKLTTLGIPLGGQLVKHRRQSLKQRCMDDMVNLAQDFHRDLTLKDVQIHSLGQGIVGRDTTIGHLKVQCHTRFLKNKPNA